jgi:hypothetical protein
LPLRFRCHDIDYAYYAAAIDAISPLLLLIIDDISFIDITIMLMILIIAPLHY